MIARLSALAGFVTLCLICLTAAGAVDLQPTIQLLPVTIVGLWFAITSATLFAMAFLTRYLAASSTPRQWRDRQKRQRSQMKRHKRWSRRR